MQVCSNEENDSLFFNFDKISNDFEYKTIKSSMPDSFVFEPFFNHFRKALLQNVADDDDKGFVKSLVYWYILIRDSYTENNDNVRKLQDLKLTLLEQIRTRLTDIFTSRVRKSDVDFYIFLENKLTQNLDILNHLDYFSRESDIKNCPELLYFLYRLSDKSKSSELLKILYFGTFKFGKASAVIGADFPNASDIARIDIHCSSFNNRYSSLFNK